MNNDDRVIMFSVSASSVTFYPERQLYNEKSKKNLKINKENNSSLISKNTQKRIRKYINIYAYMLDTKELRKEKYGISQGDNMNMITLTLSAVQSHNDQFIKKNMFEPFLRFIRENYNTKLYIWRAERQKNGNIHFHLLVNKFIDYQMIRDKWNQIQKKHGYIEKFRNNQKKKYEKGWYPDSYSKKSKKEQYNTYKKARLENWKNPNSTDVKKMDKIANVAAYVSKYLSKEKHSEVSDNENIKRKESFKLDAQDWYKKLEMSDKINISTGAVLGNCYSISNLLASVTSYSAESYDLEYNIFKEIQKQSSYNKKTEFFNYYSINLKKIEALDNFYTEFLKNVLNSYFESL